MDINNLDLQSMIIKDMANEMVKSIDHIMIYDDLWQMQQYQLHRSFTTRKGQRRHIIGVNSEISEWLMKEQNQFGRKNPDWTISDGKINISDRLYTLLILKFGEP